MIEIIAASAAACVLLAVTAVVVARCYVRVPAGKALVITVGSGEPRVTFNGAFVPPLIGNAELIDCTTKKLVVTREGRRGYRCKDKLRVSVTAEFYVRVNHTRDDVLKVALCVGAAQAGEEATPASLFQGKLDEALSTVIAHFDFDELLSKRDHLKDTVIEVIGRDLNGYVLDDAAVVSIDQVPIEQLDPDDVHDAEAITRITERTLQAKRERLALETEAAELDIALQARGR